jgi:protein TonB
MVHALAHSPRLQAGHLRASPLKDRLDPTRIAAISGAIAVNAIALLLLLMPMSTPPPVALADREPGMIWVLPEKKPKIVPVVPVPHTPPQMTQPTIKSPPQANIASPTDQVIVEQGTEAVAPVTYAIVESTTIEPPVNPIATVRLEYASAPPPAYPRDALRLRAEGTVLLQVLVDSDGRPLEVQVQSSSGNRSLDEAARKHVLKRWSFRPAMQDGRAVQAIGLVPVAFALQ